MAMSKSSLTGKSSGAAHTSIRSKDLPSRKRINIQMVQNVLLIWLDKNIDDNNKDCQNTVAYLRRAVNSIKKFTDNEECIEFLEDIKNEKTFMIISGSLGQSTVPRVHGMSQVNSIFIFCGNKEYHEQWAKEWPKIKGVFTEITSICEALKQTAQQCEHDAMPISIMTTSGDVHKTNLDQLEPTFMYTQILKEILLTIEFDEQHIHEFVQYCRDALAENEDELKNVKKFERKYRDKTPIWWYSYNCFLHSMLNRALRIMDLDVIIKMGFFINDLHRQIEQLHRDQFGVQNSNKHFKVYRGQGMSKSDFEQMSRSKGGLISFNNFLSTSRKRNISFEFTERALMDSEMVGVLFLMRIDPNKSTTPFASIAEVGHFKDKEAEVLFSMHTVFRIDEITPMHENHRLFQVELTLTSDNDNDLCALTDHIRKETYPGAKGWYRLGSVLLKMGQYDKTEQVYEILLEQTTDDDEKGRIYHLLGNAKFNREEYREANECYGKALKIYKRILSPTDSALAGCYNNIGNVYSHMDEYSKALLSYEKALEIQQKSLSPNHPDLAKSYKNIGNTYYIMDDYSKALSYYEKDLEISKRSLPPDHPELAATYDNFGMIYEDMGDLSKARSYFEQAVDIAQRSLPPNHPDLQKWKDNLERIKESGTEIVVYIRNKK